MTLGCNRPRLGESNIIPVFTDPLFGQDIFAVNILTSVYVFSSNRSGSGDII